MLETEHTILSYTQLLQVPARHFQLTGKVWAWAAKFRQAHKQKWADKKKHVTEYCNSGLLKLKPLMHTPT